MRLNDACTGKDVAGAKHITDDAVPEATPGTCISPCLAVSIPLDRHDSFVQKMRLSSLFETTQRHHTRHSRLDMYVYSRSHTDEDATARCQAARRSLLTLNNPGVTMCTTARAQKEKDASEISVAESRTAANSSHRFVSQCRATPLNGERSGLRTHLAVMYAMRRSRTPGVPQTNEPWIHPRGNGLIDLASASQSLFRLM